jgi:GNAT superfamily N-acetyltransferase
MEICRYTPEHEDAVISAIREDPAWELFTNENAVGEYKNRLRAGITYVCYENGVFGGYLRALLDEGFAVYVSEVFVAPASRNRGIGRSLLVRVRADYGYLAVYVLSDEDAYYQKLGYRKVGSVFEIHE